MQRDIGSPKGTCNACEQDFDYGQSHCSCGRPTPYASFSDRAAYEVAAWRQHLERSAQTA